MALRREATTGGAWPELSLDASSAAKPAGDSFLHEGQGQGGAAALALVAPAGPTTPRVDDGVRLAARLPSHPPVVGVALHDRLGVGGGSPIFVNTGPLAALLLPRKLVGPPSAAAAVLSPRRMRTRGRNRRGTASATAVWDGGSGDESSSESSKTMTSAGLQGWPRT